LKEASPRVFNISVPRPSLARTAAEEKTKEATPAFSALKTMPKSFPLEPLYPGVGNPPLKLIVPLLFEKDGGWTHKEKADPDWFKETTLKYSVGKFIIPSALFIASPFVSIYALTVNILFIV